MSDAEPPYIDVEVTLSWDEEIPADIDESEIHTEESYAQLLKEELGFPSREEVFNAEIQVEKELNEAEE